MAQTVTLTRREYWFASYAGYLRQVENIMLGSRKDAYGYNGLGYDIHILGALGEFAVSKGLGIPWLGPGTLRGDDVGTLQVRTTEPNRRLILHASDSNESIFVLVTAQGLTFTLIGWCYGHEGKREEYWCDPSAKNRPAYFVANDQLHAIETLRVQ